MQVQIKYIAILKESPVAILFKLSETKNAWLPKSTMDVDRDDKDITVDKWIIEKNGLMEYVTAE